ncbi:MAG: D-glycero-beta-D-manno-heptose-7-phosphate kinase [Bacteroidetes bacterium]|nr:D-glycero-beta-D-manno-heptose-7-phosphate kinase [Bacteroidota bacterium]
MDIKTFANKISELRIFVVGDVMLDAYIWGKAERLSPEAPVPVVQVEKKESRPGGAANVAYNLRALGVDTYLFGLVGKDLAAAELKKNLTSSKINSKGIYSHASLTTTIKTRVIGNKHQLLRIDEEKNITLSATERNAFTNSILEAIKKHAPHAIIFEDYDKGCIDKDLIEKITAFANKLNIITTVDPKRANFLHYKNVTLFKPNFAEIKNGLNAPTLEKNQHSLLQYTSDFLRNQKIKNMMITLSEHGVYYATPKQAGMHDALIRNIADVSGAGDTVIAIATRCLAIVLPLQLADAIANVAGGMVCEYAGVVPVNNKLFFNEIQKLNLL